MFVKAHSVRRTLLATRDEENALRIVTLSEIIRESPTPCWFLKSRKLVVTKLSSVASGWAGELATKFR
jgi:hypothetical protein